MTFWRILFIVCSQKSSNYIHLLFEKIIHLIHLIYAMNYNIANKL